MFSRDKSYLTTLIFFAGMLAAFVGERVIGSGSNARTVLTALGMLLLLGAIVVRIVRMQRAEPDRRSVEKTLLLLYVLGAVAVKLYILQSDIFQVGGKPLERDFPKLAVAFAALWPAFWLAAAAPILFVEMSYAAVARAPRLELGRVRDAMMTGFGVAGALVFAFAFTYVATERDKKVDLSYFRTARPGESSRKIVRTLDQPVQVNLFFPPANEVREEVKSYFDDLAKESKMVEVKTYDHAVDPMKAKELGVSSNGVVSIARGTRRENLAIGLELEGARSQLSNLDKEVQKRLLLVARPPKTVYLTSGHNERSFDPQGEGDKRQTVRDLREVMQQQGYTVRTLGAAEGLATDVPNDAGAVLVLGPQKPLLKEEVESLKRYFERGGRLLVALDPESGPEAAIGAKDLTQAFGITFTPVTLANDQIHVARTRQQSDRVNIATGSYSSHPSVTTLGRMGMRAPMVFFGAGYFEDVKDRPKDLTVDYTVRAHGATWADQNNNFTFDAPAEQRKPWQIAAAITRKKAGSKDAKDDGRAIFVADSDAISDGVIGNPGNAYFVLDGLKWVLGEEAIAGEVTSEVDVPVAHTKKQDQAWFYTTIFLAPAVVIGIGYLVTRKRRRAVRSQGNANHKEAA